MSFKEHDSRYLKGAREFRVKARVEDSVIEKFLCSLSCPRALTVWLLFKSGEHAQLASLGFNPEDYDGLTATRDAYFATKFLSKFKGLTLGYNLEDVALAKFSEFEALCKSTNERFTDLGVDPLFCGLTVQLHNAVVRKISRVLGTFDAEEFFDRPDWGPGATTLIRRRDASPEVKFQCETGITRDLHDLLPLNLLSVAFPHWSVVLAGNQFPNYQVGNKVITVEKDAKTNRVIAVEPGVNLFFQKSVGEMIRKRLLPFGIDIRNQRANQEAARKGSFTNLTATVDLSSASDSISWAVVQELIPVRWYTVLDSCRSRYGHLKGALVRWEKFSSMGNGFTFPLQTLIFYAVACCCTEYHGADLDEVRVYGDDIVIPSVAFETFSAMLDFYGFRINRNKSFVNSQFRESCGAHYYAGVDVKPFYLKDRISSLLSVFKTANSIRRRSHVPLVGCDERFRSVWHFVVNCVPKALRLVIPETLGDGGFIGNFDEATPHRARHGIEGYHVKTIALCSRKRVEERPGYLLAELWRIDGRSKKDFAPRMPTRLIALQYKRDEPPQDRLARKNKIPSGETRLCVLKSLVRQWVDLGPWTRLTL